MDFGNVIETPTSDTPATPAPHPTHCCTHVPPLHNHHPNPSSVLHMLIEPTKTVPVKQHFMARVRVLKRLLFDSPNEQQKGPHQPGSSLDSHLAQARSCATLWPSSNEL